MKNPVIHEESDDDNHSDQILETKPDPKTPRTPSANSVDQNEEEGNASKKKKKNLSQSSNRYIVQLYYPELAFIVLKVKNARNWYTVKMGGFKASCVRPGLRSVELFDRQLATDGFSSILLHIQVLE